MDREDVEYIQRDDDDEEFDEFGRKKKKRKMGSEVRKFYLKFIFFRKYHKSSIIAKNQNR